MKDGIYRTVPFDTVRPEPFDIVRPEPVDIVRPEPVEGTNATQDRLVEGQDAPVHPSTVR